MGISWQDEGKIAGNRRIKRVEGREWPECTVEIKEIVKE